MEKEKPKIAFFDFACCEGCQLMVLNLEERLLELLGQVEVVAWREAMTGEGDSYDIAFVEGSITREQDIPRLKKIRENAKYVVALGSCAATGCVNTIKNLHPMEEALTEVYGDEAKHFADTILAQPLDHFIEVDGYCYGCPIDRDEFLKVTTQLLLGIKPEVPDYPLCVECKMKGNVCVYFRGMTCLGVVTRAGCGAICICNGDRCEGCRGMISNPNERAAKEVLAEHGLTVEQILNEFSLFQSSSEVVSDDKKKRDD